MSGAPSTRSTPAADAKGVRIETLLDPQAAPVSGDPERLQQVLWNLLSNAVKFTNRGGRVQVRLERVDSHVEVAVSDTGIGIAPEFLPHVFERFRQADAGIARERGGLGLGLAIARQLTEMHGGTIEASSGGVNQGATFRVKIPLMIVHPSATMLPRVHPRSGASARQLRSGSSRRPRAGRRRRGRCAGPGVRSAAGRRRPREHGAVGGRTLEHVWMPKCPMLSSPIWGCRIWMASSSSTESGGIGIARVRDLPAAALTAYARSEDRMKALRPDFRSISPSRSIRLSWSRRLRPWPSGS